MTPQIILATLIGYFVFLIVIAQLTKGKADNKTFFTGNKSSHWFLVAFGMIGASLSGVTFISIPGAVAAKSFSYMQMVLGYLVGYYIIATVLIPLYYKLNLITIYTYLGKRFGVKSHKTGSAFFLISRIIGASLRLYLVASVLQLFVFDYYDIPFLLTVFITIVLIWIYTFQGGIKTIVVTDTLQTFFMLLSLGLSIYFISKALNTDFGGLVELVKESEYAKTFFFDDFFGNKLHFAKQFLSGALIALTMTGLDQDMMQKNLTCRTRKESSKNVITMSLILVPVNLMFLFLGALLFIYGAKMGITFPVNADGKLIADQVFATVAFNHLPIYAGVIFLLGLIAAAYSSADSALTSLTTTFSVDFLKLDKTKDTKKRLFVHVAFSLILMLVIFGFKQLNNDSIVWEIFKLAGYTYGPLLGLFAFGLLTKIKIKDNLVPLIAIISPVLTYIIQYISPDLIGYTFGFELLLLNACITFIGLFLLRK
ncbi:MAG: sodium:solute symporter [Chitinophagales bacterium]